MRVRLFLSFLIVILISLIGVALFVRQSAKNEVQAFLGRGGLVGAESLVEELEAYYMETGSWDSVQALMPGSEGYGRGTGAEGPGAGTRKLTALRLADASGRILFDPQNPGAVDSQESNLAYSIPLAVDETIVGYLLPQEGDQQGSAQFETHMLERINRASLYAALLSGAVALVLAVLLVYFLMYPIQSLTRAAQKIAQGDLAHRVDIDQPRELYDLSDSFNQMANSLQEADKKRKDLTADIAHELRSPLAVQRAHLEALLDGVFPIDKENIETVREQNQLLSRLVEDLRVLTLTDSGELVLDIRLHDLAELAESAVERFSAQALEKGILIDTDLCECPPVSVDAERIQQILHNLLQNGIRYSPKGGSLTLTLNRAGESALLSVRDSGPGISEDSLHYIFDRFYRVEDSRSRKSGGTGLGLAIAQNLAEVHDGSLTARNHPQGGAVFELTLPLMQNRA